MKKNILIISIYYPPIESIASNRIYSFAKYLDKNKFNIYVYTLQNRENFQDNLDGVTVLRESNDTILKRVIFEKRTGKLIHFLKVLNNKAVDFLVDDPYIGWLKKGKKRLQKLVVNKNIDCIISSFAPVASHKLALALKKEFPYIIWIADMRDEMSQSPYIGKKTKNLYKKIENDIFKYADAVTAVSKPILDEFKLLNKDENLLFKEIRNGYDFDIEKPKDRNDIFIISYIGNFYGDINPDNFFCALNELVSESLLNQFLVRFIGVKTHFTIPKKLKEKIDIVETLPHVDAIQAMKNSDALLLIHPNNGRKGVFTGKLFEYLASLTPVIALVDENDVAANLIKECNAGYVCSFSDLEGIKKIILQAYADWKNDNIKEVNIDIIKKHHRKEQAKRLERVIEELLVGE